MRADGSDKTRITHAAGADVLPVFSPDGKWLLWASKRNGASDADLRRAVLRFRAGKSAAQRRGRFSGPVSCILTLRIAIAGWRRAGTAA